MDIVKKYNGEFGVFRLNISTGEILEDSLDRDKIWEQAEIKQEQTDIDAYKIQKWIYMHIMEKIFTEDLPYDWNWYFTDFGVEYQVKTEKASYRLIVDAEGSFIFK
jgi:hypothetical protein